MSKLGTHTNVVERYVSATGAGNGETLQTNVAGKGVGIVYYDCGGSSRTGVILEAGLEDGQTVKVVNISDAAETITFATAATSLVASGTSMVVARYESVQFVWNKALNRWHGALGGGTTIADGAVTLAKLQDATTAADILVADGSKLWQSVAMSGDATISNAGAVTIGADKITTAKILDANVTPAKTNIVQAVTATADGTTTGTIAATTTHATVTSDAANKQVILPAPTPGRVVVIDVGANGFDLKSSAPATVAINGGTGAAAKSAIAANSTCFMVCVSATAWKGFFLDADSDVAKVAAAA